MKIEEKEKRDKVLETRAYMDKAITNCYKNKEASLYFFRGLLQF